MSRSIRISTRFILLVLVGALPTLAEGAIRVPADQPTIQAGIDAAVSGDTVLVAAGTYRGDGNRDLDFGGREIVVLSEDGALSTIIDCEGSFSNQHRGFYFHGGEGTASEVRGFAIANGFGPEDPGSFNGGGILCDSASSPTIAECRILDCQANGGNGGGIYCANQSSPMIVACQISGCYTNNHGGGLFCIYDALPTVERCTFTLNEGEGAAAWAGSVPTDDSAPTFTDCVFEGNRTVNGPYGGGAIAVAGDARVALTDCLLSNNDADGYDGRGGGGLWVDGPATATLSGCTIAGNRTPGGSGGGVLVTGGAATVTLEHTIIWGNCAGEVGDQIHLADGPSTIELVCCCVDAAGVSGPVSYLGEQVLEAPLFCESIACDDAPATGGDYTLATNSPCVADASPCGVLIGVLDAACPPNAVEAATWGRIKARFQAP